MALREDPRLEEARALALDGIADRLGLSSALARVGPELVGPCPVCGGRDRFAINTRKATFLCRKCDGRGDGIDLVRFVLGLDFAGALRWLVGDAPAVIDPAERARRAKQSERARQDQEARAARERAKAIEAARGIWRNGRPIEATAAADYLDRRGLRALVAHPPACLRFHPALPYMIRRGDGAGWREVHRGPALLAAIQGPDGRFCGVHRTWLDLTRPKGKAEITHDGAELPAKKVLGSKKGGAIRLVRPKGAALLVMGEGIETTATAAIAELHDGAAYWAGIDLGNMAGRRKLGQGLRYAGIPDLSDGEAFIPPEGVARLIYIADGDSDPKLTRAQLLAGLRRAMALRPGLRGSILHPGDGCDLNDLLMTSAA